MLRRSLPIMFLLLGVLLIFVLMLLPVGRMRVSAEDLVTNTPVSESTLAPAETVVVTAVPVVTDVPTAIPTPIPDSGDSVKIPMPLLAVIGIVVLILLGGFLLLLSQIIKALEGMYPPGTVATMAKAIADGIERVIGQLNQNAPTTTTNADDFLLAITDPLTKAIISKLREQGAILLPEKPAGT